MSIKTMVSIWELTLPPLHKLVLLALADSYGECDFDLDSATELVFRKTGIDHCSSAHIWESLYAANFVVRSPQNGWRMGILGQAPQEENTEETSEIVLLGVLDM
jgi:hypothetical protein